jgi:hypothetical protein
MAKSERPKTAKRSGKGRGGKHPLALAGEVPEHPVDPRRDALGRIKAGNTINPGGIPALALELRKLALANAEDALRLAIEWMHSKDEDTAERGLRIVLERALGKDGRVKDLPVDAAALPELDTSPAGLLGLSTRALARVLQHLERRAASGEALSPEETSQLTDAARMLGALAKEEREQQKTGPERNLPSDVLLQRLLPMLPDSVLRQEMARRDAAPPVHVPEAPHA